MGLEKEYWKKVVKSLNDIIPIYNKINFYISLGKDEEYRRLGIDWNIKENDLVLDAGSGFGNMSKSALAKTKNVRITLFDPLTSMLKNSHKHLHNNPDMISGIFEYIPIRSDKFDVALCGYSLRDALNVETAISEIHRVLKKGGRWIIVDLGKPDKKIVRLGVLFYLYAILPIIAFLAGGKLGLKFNRICGTYERWLTNKSLLKLLKVKFTKIEVHERLMGGAIMIIGHK